MAAEMSWKEGKTVNIADVKSSKTNGYASWVQCTQVEHLSVGTVSVKRQCLIKESHARKKRVPNLFIERKRVSDAVSTDSYIVSCLPTSLFWLESHHVGVCLCPVVAFKVQEVLQRAQLSPKTLCQAPNLGAEKVLLLCWRCWKFVPSLALEVASGSLKPGQAGLSDLILSMLELSCFFLCLTHRRCHWILSDMFSKPK